MQYKLLNNSSGIELTDDNGITKSIPNDFFNRDWQEYQAWLAADPENQPLPADEE